MLPNSYALCASPRPLSTLHNRRIAVQMTFLGRNETLLGSGRYERDVDLGTILRIELLDDSDNELILVEREWVGQIRSGEAHGCDFLIHLN